MNRILRNPSMYVVFLLPALVIYSIFIVYPIIQSIYYSFFKWDALGDKLFIGLSNYKTLLSDQLFHVAFQNTLLLLGFSVCIGTPLALFLAIVLSKTFVGDSIMKTAVFIPTVLSTVIVGVLWNFVYHPEIGTLNYILSLIGLEQFQQPWLAQTETAMGAILVANTWQWLGFHTVILLAGVKNIPKDVLEAAHIDGAGAITRTFKIIIPMMWPVITVDILLTITGSLRAFDIVYIMTRGGPAYSTEIMATYMYTKAFTEFNYGYGSTIATAILVFTLTVALVFQRLARRGE
ncbi:carbohydrate ABC transporter permease [Bacillus alkalicellulosilyticus]|uniref:carbohydrate ABC transporter permease n=1 Tax=Alkalihalobacterium alkalicellulosilyticum TaxID=1912214 RepID=UPI001483A958|nr:sugar ABC transporter permease [Bacillus alkalicellulosilyticus]